MINLKDNKFTTEVLQECIQNDYDDAQIIELFMKDERLISFMEDKDYIKLMNDFNADVVFVDESFDNLDDFDKEGLTEDSKEIGFIIHVSPEDNYIERMVFDTEHTFTIEKNFYKYYAIVNNIFVNIIDSMEEEDRFWFSPTFFQYISFSLLIPREEFREYSKNVYMRFLNGGDLPEDEAMMIAFQEMREHFNTTHGTVLAYIQNEEEFWEVSNAEQEPKIIH